LHPKSAFDTLYERIRKSISRGNQVVLTITWNPLGSSFHSSKFIENSQYDQVEHGSIESSRISFFLSRIRELFSA
jgi:hypothetical protein